MKIRKVAFAFFEVIAFVSFLLILCVDDFKSYWAFLGLIGVFVASAVIAVVLDNPHRIGRYVFPAFICLLSLIYQISKPLVKVLSMCYKAKVASGSYRKCFRDIQSRYDDIHKINTEEVVEEEEEPLEYEDAYYESWEDGYIVSSDGKYFYSL